MQPLLYANQLNYTVRSRTLIKEVSISLNEGKVLAFVGPNGAGKSTLLQLLAGDISPQDGTILLEGKPLTSYPPKQLARIRAVLMQQTLIRFAFRAEEIVAMGRYPHRTRGTISAQEEHDYVQRALQQTETEALRTRLYSTLSGGEAARILFAKALAQETRLLFCDEPTAALDVRHQELIMNLTRWLAAQGKAVCIVLHDLNLAAAYADEIVVLEKGRVIAQGSPKETLTAEILSKVYDYPMHVMDHPRRDCPLIVADGHQLFTHLTPL